MVEAEIEANPIALVPLSFTGMALTTPARDDEIGAAQVLVARLPVPMKQNHVEQRRPSTRNRDTLVVIGEIPVGLAAKLKKLGNPYGVAMYEYIGLVIAPPDRV
jgi:hypothetical protein